MDQVTENKQESPEVDPEALKPSIMLRAGEYIQKFFEIYKPNLTGTENLVECNALVHACARITAVTFSGVVAAGHDSASLIADHSARIKVMLDEIEQAAKANYVASADQEKEEEKIA
jgi:hypothetical protein